jgi:phospholipid-binding lipoprotein MlaA
MKHLIISLIAIATLGLSGCASKPSSTADVTDPRDPAESFNRAMWTANFEYLDPYILRPATVGYMTVTPSPLRVGLANMVNNLDEPANMVNGVLQGKGKSTAISTGRFLVNSTIGVLGFFDVASHLELAQQNEDFSQTLGVWGVGYGPYLMIPGMGPTTVRDTVGRVVDNLYFPMTLLNNHLTVGKFVVGALDGREKLMAQEKMLNDSLDPYAFVKDAYFQRQDYKLYDGEPPQQEVDEAALEEFLE